MAAETNNGGATDAGDTITWTFLVTNAATAIVHGLKVSDPTAGRVTCPATTLRPRQSVTCTAAEHVITDAEAAAGHVHNVATATALGINGVSFTSKQGTVGVSATRIRPLRAAVPARP